MSTDKHRILYAVLALQGPSASCGVCTTSIAADLSVPRETVRYHVQQLARGTSPLVYHAPEGGVRLTFLGEQEIDDACADARMRHPAAHWIDRVRWPWEEAYSRLDNVAIPRSSGERGGRRSPERAAWRSAQRLLPHQGQFSEEDLAAAWREIAG